MKWRFLKPDRDIVAKLQDEFQCSEIIAKVMANRGIQSLKAPVPFFNYDLKLLHDPYLMKDMDKAVGRIIHNIHHKIPILMFGDYDADGTSASAVLYLGLKSMGAVVSTYIPERNSEGYGLSILGIQKTQSIGADLIITCDCGINAFEEILFSNSINIDVIVTDHHLPDEILPEEFAILNPKRSGCSYPFDGLCGSGAAFKLIMAIEQKKNKNIQLNVRDIKLSE